MALVPAPCSCGSGGGSGGDACCSPSITAQPLCCDDGRTVLVVLRSACADCGDTGLSPEVAGWVDPTSGIFTPGPAPAGCGACSSPCADTVCVQRCDDTTGDGQSDTTYTELWCVRADGTASLLLTYQDDPSTPYTPVAPVDCVYGCPESETLQLCDENGPFLRRYTWLDGSATYEDFALDGVTAYVVTGTVGACPPVTSSKDCLDTVCRIRCDDTDGDGQANTTYSELWCVHADGTTELLLSYQDDPATPYTPVAPVDCTYGSVDTETLTLCDETGPFLRRYTWTGGAAAFEDVELDGMTVHIVTGAVGVCPAAPDCEAQTTPVATLGLCLADGTPIAVLVTRDCDGTVTQGGWLNLSTGAYSAGDPPVGTMACGNPRSISTTGTFCDVDPDSGDVLGLVLIEYTYDADGAVTAVRLVDATTGTDYTPQGEITTCPAGVAQPERDLVQLCDVAADGTATEFVRDYARDENGAIAGHTDYVLDGTPYTPTGTVGRCLAAECQDCATVLLCDENGTPPATIAGAAASGTLPNGVTYAVTAPAAFVPGRQSDGAAWWGVALFPNPVVPTTRWTFNQPVNVDFSVAMTYSTGTAAGENTVQLPSGAVPLSLPNGYSYNQTTHVLTAGPALNSAGCPLNSPTRAASARFRVAGVSTFTLKYLGPRVLSTVCQRFGTWEFGALDVSVGGPFLRTVCRDCTGAVVSTTDTLLDGETPYAPTGLVGVCQPEAEDPQPVETDTEVVQLCDLGAQDAAPVPFLRHLAYKPGAAAPTVTDTTLDGVTPYVPTGTVGLCTQEPDCPAQSVIEVCRCDDTDGDGVADFGYAELLAVDCDGNLSSLGTYTDGLAEPYSPVAPIPCDAGDEEDAGAERAFGVQTRRIELAQGATWKAASVATLQSVTAVAHGGTGTITTVDGPSTLYAGEAATWSVARDVDALLIGPLTITADTGTVTITWTQGVTLS